MCESWTNHYDLFSLYCGGGKWLWSKITKMLFFLKNLKYIIVMVFNLLIVKTRQDPYSQILWYSWDWPVKITWNINHFEKNILKSWFVFHVVNVILAKLVLQLSSMTRVFKDSSLPLYAGTGNPSWILHECSHRRHWCNCYHSCSNSWGK